MAQVKISERTLKCEECGRMDSELVYTKYDPKKICSWCMKKKRLERNYSPESR